jgi:hypothetical protein
MRQKKVYSLLKVLPAKECIDFFKGGWDKFYLYKAVPGTIILIPGIYRLVKSFKKRTAGFTRCFTGKKSKKLALFFKKICPNTALINLLHYFFTIVMRLWKICFIK